MVEIKSIECNSIECNSIGSIEHNFIDTPNLNNQQFRLNRISEIEEYFTVEVKERELMTKNSANIFLFFYYFDKSLIVLSVTSGVVSIASFATAIGAPIGITSGSLSFGFSLCTGLVKKLLKATRNKKRSIIKLLC